MKAKKIYETEELLNQYLLLHYGTINDTSDFVPENAIGFPKKCAALLIKESQNRGVSPTRVLDLGCSVGGASFELAREFGEVVAIDISESFIAAANNLKITGKIDYVRKEEGELYSPITAVVDPTIDRSRVLFQVGDACSLPLDIGEFDVALVANLLCRLPNPSSCLMRMSGPFGLIKKGGLLLITTPYSWLSSYTASAGWLGGKKINDIPLSSYAGLRQILEKNFEFLFEKNIPLVIRDHYRKFEFIISHATCWCRVS